MWPLGDTVSWCWANRLDDLRGLFQPKWFYDPIRILCSFIQIPMKGKVTPWAVLAISFLPHRKTQFAKADGTSGQSCQVQCLQQWSVPGASEALPPTSTWPHAWCRTERTNSSSGPAALTWCTTDTHKDKCSIQILGCCRSALHLKSQDSPLGYDWAQHMH